MNPSHFSSLASILLNSALRNSYIWCLHILSMGVWTFLWGVFDYNAMASRRRKSPPRPLPNPDLDHDTDSSLDRRQERWTKAMIQKIHKIQGDDSHCFASCPTLALSTKTYRVVFFLTGPRLSFEATWLCWRSKWMELGTGNIALHLSSFMHCLTC